MILKILRFSSTVEDFFLIREELSGVLNEESDWFTDCSGVLCCSLWFELKTVPICNFSFDILSRFGVKSPAASKPERAFSLWKLFLVTIFISAGKWCFATSLKPFALQWVFKAARHWAFTGPKTAKSRGCNMWLVWAANLYKVMLFLIDKSISFMVIWEATIKVLTHFIWLIPFSLKIKIFILQRLEHICLNA